MSNLQAVTCKSAQMSEKLRGQKRQRSRGAVIVEDQARPLQNARKQAAVTQLAQRKAQEAKRKAEEEQESAKQVLRSLQAIVINLVRRPDRMDGCAQRLRLYSPGLHFERFEATDGRAVEIPESEVVWSWHTAQNVVYQRLRAIRKGWDDLDTYQERNLDMSPGERGCASSHIRAWRHCLEQSAGSERPLLVLEDDAAPTPAFATLLARALAALPQDAHLLYLGYSQAAEWRREVSPELVESEYVWTTVGYIVWPAGARILLSQLPVSGPVDNWMAGLCAAGQLKAYCVRPKIVRQAEPWNVNSDVGHSDEHYWGPCSDIHHSDAFYWGPPEVSHARHEELCVSSHTGADGGGGAGCGGVALASLPEGELPDPPPRPFAAGSCFWDLDSADSEDSSDDN
jgi:GR25 family glycosyltransferase involved in LPS biosynthesis